MNGTNKKIVGAVYGVALAYAGLAFVLTVLSFEGDAGTVIPGIAVIHGPYSEFVAPLSVNFAVALGGFALSVAGMMTSEPLDVIGRENPVQYLWTHRPNAFIRCLAAPWGLITSAWKRSKPLVIVPIVLLPFYAVWSAIITVALIAPFLVAKAIVSWKISSAVKKERHDYRVNTEFGVCPFCLREFARPQAVCKCGLIIDYPVPGIHGIRTQTCNNGDEIKCYAGGRSDLATTCPYCKEVIDTREARPVCIALAGAVDSGKTTLMLAGVESIMDRAKRRDIPTQVSTEGLSAEARSGKDAVLPTDPGMKGSQCIFLKPMGRHETELVINDASGSEFEPSRTKHVYEEYYKYVDGVVFVLDPVKLGKRGPDIKETFDSFYGMYSLVKGSKAGTVFKSRLAVVATRQDVTKLSDENVREYILGKGCENFVKTVETVFENVRYFSVCSVGKNSSGSARPFIWILEASDPELAEDLETSDTTNR